MFSFKFSSTCFLKKSETKKEAKEDEVEEAKEEDGEEEELEKVEEKMDTSSPWPESGSNNANVSNPVTPTFNGFYKKSFFQNPNQT